MTVFSGLPTDSSERTEMEQRAFGLLEELSAQINSARLSFASPEAMEEYLGVTPGSAGVLSLVKDTECAVKLLIDDDLLKEEYFGCHPCKNTSSLRITTQDLLEKILPHVKHEYTAVTLVGVE
ncbi:MAG: hypothetical protein IJW37_02830 [Lachnospiraceae bacterium]|nr:hypothetical protein [Lachnospiraceae bacterium]